MAIFKTLDLSTAHITEDDSLLLNNFNSLPFRVLTDEYGYFISGYMGNTELEDYGFSNDFISVIKHARFNDCTYICLDRDAEVIDGLHTNEW